MHVLVADPDPLRQDSLRKGLPLLWANAEAAEVLCTSTGEDALQFVRTYSPDIVLLATELSDRSVLDVLRDIRWISDVPIMLLADRGEDSEHIQALQLGADDYVVRPVSAAVLSARIQAVLRRGRLVLRSGSQPDLQVGRLALWFGPREVTIAGTPLRLTPLEFRLLSQLAQHAGEVVPSEVLLDQIWGGSYAATTKYLKVFVNRLRATLAAHGWSRCIETRRGVGYRMVLPRQ